MLCDVGGHGEVILNDGIVKTGESVIWMCDGGNFSPFLASKAGSAVENKGIELEGD